MIKNKMETLERKAEKGYVLSIGSPKIITNGFFIELLKGKIERRMVIENYHIHKLLREFEREYHIKMPDLKSEDWRKNNQVEFILKKGFPKNSFYLKTNLKFEFDSLLESYISKLSIQNEDWINHIKEDSGKSPFSREIYYGKSKENFLKAYSDMLNNF